MGESESLNDLETDTMPSEYCTQRQIEFSDTDMAGIAHFSRFFVFMETAEHEFLRSLGTSVATKWQGNKIGWPRLSASCEYLNPVIYEDVLDIHLAILRKGRTSMTYQFLFTKDGVEIARGQMKTACCICNAGEELRAIPIPDFVANQINELPPASPTT